MKPSLITGNKTEKKIWKEKVISADQANQITKMLTQVVEHPKGSGHGINDLGIKIAAKTGTAEIKLPKTPTEQKTAGSSLWTRKIQNFYGMDD